MPSDSPVQPSIAGRSDLPLSLISAGVFDKTHPTRPGWSAQVRVCRGEAVRAERHSMPLSSLLGCVHVSWIICARIAVSACSQGTPPTWCDSMCPPHGAGGDRDGVLHAAPGWVPTRSTLGGAAVTAAHIALHGQAPGTGTFFGGLVPSWGPGREQQPRACERRWERAQPGPS